MREETGMTRNNVKIAITGGIGSGKSTVAEIISGQGYKVVSCDKVYGGLLERGEFTAEIESEFGDISDDGKVDRKKLAAKVFCDKAKIKRLNEITHPKIMQNALSEMEREGAAFCEVPLLFEGGYEGLFDGVIVVLRDTDGRVKAVVKRDKISEREALSRISRQFGYEAADLSKYYVIRNLSDMKDLKKRTLEVLAAVSAEFFVD